MKVTRTHFLVLSLVLAFLVITVLSPMASANPVSVWTFNLDWRLLPIVSLFNYAVNLGIVVAAFWFVKRKINSALVKKLATIVLFVTLIGMCTILIIGIVSTGQASGSYFVFRFLIPVSVVEVPVLAFLLRRGKLSTFEQGFWIGAAMIIVGFFAGFPATFSIL